MNKYWKTASGKKLPLNTMDDKHLDNCINMLRTKAKRAAFNKKLDGLSETDQKRYERHKKLKRVLKEEEEFFDDYDIIWEKEVIEGYWDLIYEKKRRENNLF